MDIVRQEGVHVLWSGWQASLARSFFYGGEDAVHNPATQHVNNAPYNEHSGADVSLAAAGARLGLYEPVKRLIGADTQPSFLKNVVAGSTSGGLAAVICNPTELVKVSRWPG